MSLWYSELGLNHGRLARYKSGALDCLDLLLLPSYPSSRKWLIVFALE